MVVLKSGVSLALVGLISVMTTGLASEPASAQDSFKDDFSPVSFFSWTGFYAGLNAGGHWSSSDSVNRSLSAPGLGTFQDSVEVDLNGFIGGGQIGYNWQMGTVVVGIEADIQGVDAKNTFRDTVTVAAVPVSVAISRKLEYLGTVRGRLGVTPNANTLLYATGGFAYGGVELSAAASAPGFGSGAIKSSETATGWTAGGGAEFAVWTNTILRWEYLYYDLGEQKTTEGGTILGVTGTGTAKSDYSGHIARLGVNWKF